jgi:hypothetical protein
MTDGLHTINWETRVYREINLDINIKKTALYGYKYVKRVGRASKMGEARNIFRILIWKLLQ